MNPEKHSLKTYIDNHVLKNAVHEIFGTTNVFCEDYSLDNNRIAIILHAHKANQSLWFFPNDAIINWVKNNPNNKQTLIK